MKRDIILSSFCKLKAQGLRRFSVYAFLLGAFLLSACGNEYFALSYQVVLPPVPASWLSILGSPHWRLEWIDSGGNKETRDLDENQVATIQVLGEWANPVMAYPFWPLQGVTPDTMRPAGAIFPFDVDGDQIRLTWQGGIDGLLYLELAAHSEKPASGTPRYPHYFNWPRFRELLESPDINGTVQRDPWTADWKAIALKISQSGFDRRRIVPLSRENMLVPIAHVGPWIGTSPFADPIQQEAGQDLQLQVCGKVDTYLSSGGILRCTKGVWIWLPWEK